MGLVQNVWQLIGARAAMGIFSGFSAAATAMVATTVPEEQLGFSLGWMATGQLAGALVGPLIGGLLAAHFHGYRTVFFWTSGFAFVAVLTASFFVREQFAKPSADAKRVSFVASFLEVVRHPQLLPMFVVVLVAQIVAFGVQPIVPLYVRAMAGDVPWLPIAAGGAFAVMGVADLLASPFLGKRSDKIGYRRVLLISLAGVAAFTVPQAFAWSVGAFLVMRFGVGLFLGGVLPTANALIGRVFPAERRGQVYGITSSATFLGMSLGPLIGGAVAARFRFSSRLPDDRRVDAGESRLGCVQRAASAAGTGADSLNARTKAVTPARSVSVKRATSGCRRRRRRRSLRRQTAVRRSPEPMPFANDVAGKFVDVIDHDRLAARHGSPAHALAGGQARTRGPAVNGPRTSSPLPAFTK